MKKINLLIIMVLLGQAAMCQVTITGKVTATDGTPLSGASIFEKNTNNGVVSNATGNYVINVADRNATLIVSYAGFATREISTGGKSAVDVSLAANLSSLDEVVVVGYGNQKSKNVTGSVVTLKPQDFTPGTNNDARQLLKGTASGVNVSQTSSAPGTGMKITIRGTNSINSDNGALFVVDGLPGVDPSSLSPDDIASIEVLKDASAGAIYGTRAANGVVLITTKKGKAGKVVSNFSSYYGVQDVPKIVDVLGAADYMQLVNFRLANRNLAAQFTDDQIAKAGAGTNWQNAVFKKAAPIQNHQLSFAGGGSNGNYYMGFNYFNQDGLVIGSNNEKYNIRLNVETRPLEKLKISTSLNFTREQTQSVYSQGTDGGMLSSAIRADPTVPDTLGPDGRYLDVGSSAQDNPLGLAKGVDNVLLSNRIYGTITTEYEVVKNLTATLRLGAQSADARQDIYSNRLSQGGFGSGGTGTVGSSQNSQWLAEALIKYEKTFKEIHDFSFLAGTTFEEFLSRGVTANSRRFLSDITGTNLLQSGDGDLGDNVSSSKFKNQLNGFLGRLTYGYDDKYLLTASFRVDGSSRFSDENKYAFFPSASLGWRITQEDFMQSAPSWLNELKLRVGYGQLGNQGIDNFETRQTLVAGGNSVFADAITQGVIAARLPNPDLKWETTAEINIGLDYSLLNNRISGSVEYYDRRTYNQLFIKPLPSVVGFSSVRTNTGEVSNRGIDFNIKTLNVNKVIRWNSNIVMSFLKNEVTSLPDFTQQIVGGFAGNFVSGYWIVTEGQPLRSYYGYEITGIFQKGDDVANSPTPAAQGYLPGMPKFKDQNNDGKIDADDRVIIGDPFPDFSYGIRNTFSYKNFSLDVFINGVEGVKTFNNDIAESLYPINTYTNSLSKYWYERWTPDNPSSTLPSGVNYSLYAGARAINTLTVTDASYVRLKNVTLAYSLPLKNKSSKAIDIYVSGDNIFTITDFSGYDPEASIQGGGIDNRSYNSYPLARTYRVGLNVKF